jgi:hypothetical protein
LKCSAPGGGHRRVVAASHAGPDDVVQSPLSRRCRPPAGAGIATKEPPKDTCAIRAVDGIEVSRRVVDQNHFLVG